MQNELEAERRLKPFKEEIAAKELKIERLEQRIEEIRDGEADARAKEAAIQKDLREELSVAKEAVDMYLKEMTKSKRELEEAKERYEGDNGPMKKVKMMERRLHEVTEQCEAMIKHKDWEIGEKNVIVGRLQKKLVEDSKRFQEFADMWDKRVQEKEKGYNKAVAELSFAEGQIVEERKRTEIEKQKVKARIRDIERLKAEHREELRIREKYRRELEVVIEELEVKIEEEADQRLGERVALEVQLDDSKRR